jgi:hypothetical protein
MMQSKAVWVVLLARIAMAIAIAATMSAAAAASPVERLTATGAAQLSPSVMLMSETDWRMFVGSDDKPQSRCLDTVARSREYTSSNKLNFVPFSNWLPKFDGLGVSSYGYMPFGNNTQSEDYNESGPSNQVPQAPGDSAVAPAPEAAVASPSPVITSVLVAEPAATPAASSKSRATIKQLMLVLSLLLPLLCSAIIAAGCGFECAIAGSGSGWPIPWEPLSALVL